MLTVTEMANRVLDERRANWEKTDPGTAIVSTGELGPDDERAVRRVVAEAGYNGPRFESVVKEVCDRVVGRVEALKDRMPATDAD